MARVFAYASHQYVHTDDRGRQIAYGWSANGWREVPDDVANVVCAAHPDKLVRLGPGENKPGENRPGENRPQEPVAEPVVVVAPVAEVVVEVAPVAEAEAKPKLVLFRSVLKKDK